MARSIEEIDKALARLEGKEARTVVRTRLSQSTEAVLDRLEDTQAAHSATLYEHSRRLARVELGMGRLLAHFGIAPVTGDDVDEALDGQ